MILKEVRFGIEIEMYGYYSDDEFVNVMQKEFHKMLLPVRLHNIRDDDNIPSGYWAFKSDASISPPKKAITTNIQQVGYRKGEQQFLPFDKIHHIEPETGIHIPDKELHNRTIIPYDKKPELPFTESRLRDKPEIELGGEKLKAFKVSSSEYNKIELVSPPLKFVDSNIKLVGEIIDILRRIRMKVNESTGIHVHVSFPNINLFSFLKIFHFINEHKVYEMWPTRINNEFASSKEKMEPKIEQFLDKIFDENFNSFENYATISNLNNIARQIGKRYLGINTQSFSQHGTIEFRYAASTTKSNKVIEWLDYLRDLVAYCIHTKEIKGLMNKFDVREEKEGLLEISVRSIVPSKHEKFLGMHGAENEKYFATNVDLIDKFAHQKEDVIKFLTEYNRNDPLKIKVLIYNYINGVGELKYEQVSNIFVNLIKFINAVIDASLLSKEEFVDFLFDVYSGGLYNTSDFIKKIKKEIKKFGDNNEFALNFSYLKDVHPDTIIYILDKTVFKTTSKKDVLHKVLDKFETFTRTKEGSRLLSSLISRLGVSTEEIASLSLDNIQNFISILIEISEDYRTPEQEVDEINKQILYIMEKIGKQNSKLLFVTSDEDDGLLYFKDFLKISNYNYDKAKSIFGDDKDFYSKQLEFFKEAYDENFFEMELPFFIKAADTKTILDKVEIFKENETHNVLQVYKMLRTYSNNDIKGFLEYYLKEKSKTAVNKKLVEILQKYYISKTMSVFDMYEMIKSLAEQNDYNMNNIYNIGTEMDNDIYAPLSAGAKYAFSNNDVLAAQFKSIEKEKNNPKVMQTTIDLFKLLFKKYTKQAVSAIYHFNSMLGISEFNKPEYLKNVSQRTIEFILRDMHEDDLKKPEVINFLRSLIEQKETVKLDILINFFAEPRQPVHKDIKKLINDFPTDEVFQRIEQTSSSRDDQLATVKELIGNFNDNISKLNVNEEQFAKKCAYILRMKDFSELDYALRITPNVMYSLTIKNRTGNTGFTEFTGFAKTLYDYMDEQTKLFVKLALYSEFPNIVNYEDKHKIIANIKNVNFAYDFFRLYYYFSNKVMPWREKIEDIINILAPVDKTFLKENYELVSKAFLKNTSPKKNDDINYTKLLSIQEDVLFQILNLYLSRLTSIPEKYFATHMKLLKPIYDRVIAKKGLINNLTKQLKDKGNSLLYLKNHIDTMFLYNKLKKHNFKFVKQTDPEDEEIYSYNIEFNIGEKKYKIKIFKFWNDSFDINKVASKRYGVMIKCWANGSIIYDESVTEGGEDLVSQAYNSAINALKEKNKTLNKLFTYKRSHSNFQIFLYNIIHHWESESSVKEFGNGVKSNKITEDVTKIDYNKEFKRIMIENGIREAKKFLIENKNNITDKKLTAIMKQFSIR